MKVVLVKPDIPEGYPLTRCEPEVHLGLASISGVLIQNGIDVSIIDNYLERKDVPNLIRDLKRLKPDIVGINCDLVTVDEVKRMVSSIKEDVNVTTVVGGPEVSVHPKETFEKIRPDFCIRGEGEYTMLELCKAIDNSEYGEIERIDGIIYSKNGSVRINPPRQLMKDMDSLPFMPLHLFPLNSYNRKFKEMIQHPVDLMCTSRGCPYNCAFCSNEFVWGRRIRSMSPKRVVDEVEHMMEKYGTKGINFREDNFTIQRKRTIEISNEILERGLNIEWICESRVDTLDEEIVRKMAKAGCKSIWFGVESGSQRILDMLNKRISLEQTKKAFQLCEKYGIKRGASVMLGVPGETKDEMQKTIDFLKSLNPDYIILNKFIGIPGSEFYERIKDRGDLHYDKFGGIILLNTEEVTWPEKCKFAEEAMMKFNMANWKAFSKMFFRKLKDKGPIYVANAGMKHIRLLIKGNL